MAELVSNTDILIEKIGLKGTSFEGPDGGGGRVELGVGMAITYSTQLLFKVSNSFMQTIMAT